MTNLNDDERGYKWTPLGQGSSPHPGEQKGRMFGKCPPWVTLNRNLRCLVFIGTLITLWITIRTVHYIKFEYDQDYRLVRIGASMEIGHLKPSDFAVPTLPTVWYEERCFPGGRQLGQSVADIYEKLELLKGSNIPECLIIWIIFDRMFRMDLIHAPIVLPTEFQTEVKGWLANDPKLFDQVNHQVVYKIVNKDSFEETVFNPLRSRRPVSKSDEDPLEYIANLANSTKASCDFCKYKEHTAADVFGRIENKYSASASNTFKLAKFHGLFFPKTHHPLDVSYEAIADLFINTSRQWFSQAQQSDVSQRYPSLLWDVLPHAGASQVHPHVHGILDSHQYAGSLEKMHDIAQRYFITYRKSYWTDLILVHWALGLGLSYDKAVAIVPLFARKDHEYMIFSETVNENFAKMIHKVLESYKKHLGVYCFSSGGAYPVIGDPTDIDRYTEPGLPVMFRFGSRGVCTSRSSDVSSLDLYTVNNINSDISKTFHALKDSFKFSSLATPQ